MKREIKFRAWDGKKMYLPEYSDKEDFHILADGTMVETHEYGYERHELTSNRDDNWILIQFTGLKDKNNKDIYEGDILRCGDKIMQVIFENGCFYTPHEESKYRLGGWTNGTLEIIGNIFQNPNLLTNG